MAHSVYRLLHLPKLHNKKIWSRASSFLLPFLKFRVKVYNGRKFIPIIVKQGMLGTYIGDYCVTKSLGKIIHINKIQKAQEGKKQKGKKEDKKDKKDKK